MTESYPYPNLAVTLTQNTSDVTAACTPFVNGITFTKHGSTAAMAMQALCRHLVNHYGLDPAYGPMTGTGAATITFPGIYSGLG